MKRTIFLLTALMAYITVSTAQCADIIGEVLRRSAEKKVASMQELIKFDDTQAVKLYELEYTFLMDVRETEKCVLCNKKKRVEKLKQKRDADLQQILTRDQYIKYNAIEEERIKKHPLWAE